MHFCESVSTIKTNEPAQNAKKIEILLKFFARGKETLGQAIGIGID
jgi:hypothetical protein